MLYKSNEEIFRLFYIPLVGGEKLANTRKVSDTIKFLGDLVGRQLPREPANIPKSKKKRDQQPYCRLIDHVSMVHADYHNWETQVHKEYRSWEAQALAMGTFNEAAKTERMAQIEAALTERMRQIAQEQRKYLEENYRAIETVGSRDVQLLEKILHQLEGLESEQLKEMARANLLETASSFRVQLNAPRQVMMAFEDDNSHPSSSGDTRMAPQEEQEHEELLPDPAADAVEQYKPNAKRFKRLDSEPSSSGDAKMAIPLGVVLTRSHQVVEAMEQVTKHYQCERKAFEDADSQDAELITVDQVAEGVEQMNKPARLALEDDDFQDAELMTVDQAVEAVCLALEDDD